jgi:hypothetical protein
MLPGAAPGRRFVAARITDGAGQVLEDAAVIAAGEAAPPADLAAGLPLGELTRLAGAREQALAAEAELLLLTPELTLPPGGCGEIRAALANRTASAIRGEAQLVSPFGSWDKIRPWTQGFSAEPGGDATCVFRVQVPATARPGQHWWALVKVMYFGRLRYSEPAAVTIGS